MLRIDSVFPTLDIIPSLLKNFQGWHFTLKLRTLSTENSSGIKKFATSCNLKVVLLDVCLDDMSSLDILLSLTVSRCDYDCPMDSALVG